MITQQRPVMRVPVILFSGMPQLRRLLVISLACALVAAAALLGAPEGRDGVPRVLLVSIDGLMPSRYTAAAPAKIPHIRELMARGAHADGVTGVFPSVTYPSHTTLITGVPPAVHGIVDNRIVDPERRANGAWYWYAREIRAVTLPMAARARGLRAGAVSWPVTVGMPIDYLIPEFWRSNHPESLLLLRALSRPGDVIDAAEIGLDRGLDWPMTDRDRTDLARFILRTYEPELMLVHLIELDTAQHLTGPGSEESLASLERIDDYVGDLLETLDDAGLLELTNVAVVSDHGFLEVKQQLQPNAAFKRAGLITVDEAETVTGWRAWFHSSGGSGFVFLSDPSDAALRGRVHAVLKELQSDPAAGVRKIYTRAELDLMGAHPGASFALDVVDGFYTSVAHDALIAPAATRGGHGFDPARPELRASLVMAGPAVARRGSVGTIRMTQVAPTLAGILGVGLSPQADEPIPLIND
jgi:predicted AlkP superfamily pyrophosphatase or phosphodiesterase